MYFKHLIFAKQTYFEHFKDSFKYSFLCLKASFFFICHAFYPDIFETAGSELIVKLNLLLYNKYDKIRN